MSDKKFVSLEDILSRDSVELAELKTGEFETEKLGLVAWTAVTPGEYRSIKKQCFKMEPDGKGGMTPNLDDDKLMVRLVIAAVDKDPRSTFTFANKELLTKLGVATADEAVDKLLLPGEVYRWAVAIQNASGFGAKKRKEDAELVKNS